MLVDISEITTSPYKNYLPLSKKTTNYQKFFMV